MMLYFMYSPLNQKTPILFCRCIIAVLKGMASLALMSGICNGWMIKMTIKNIKFVNNTSIINTHPMEVPYAMHPTY